MSFFPSLSGVKPLSGSAGVIPPGKSLVAITDVAVKSNPNGWEGVTLTFTIQDGKFKDRKLVRSFTTAYPANKEIAERGKGELVGLLTAFGHPNIEGANANNIKGLKGVLVHRHRKNKQTGETENFIVNWLPASAYEPAQTAALNGGAQPGAVPGLYSIGATRAPDPQPKSDMPNDDIPF